MDTQLKLIIADDEPFICGMLEKLIHFDTLGIELVKMVHDGENLLEEITKHRPDIVLTDISMPKKDGLEVIKCCREREYSCRFIIISGYKQFEYAYNALKYNVDDYILKPVQEEELNGVLKRISDEIRHKELIEQGQQKSERDTYFIETATHRELKSNVMSMNEINQLYHTKFQQGQFRMLMLKLDFTRGDEQFTEDNSSVVKKLHDLVRQDFEELCFDIVLTDMWDGTMFLLNYDLEKENAVERTIKNLFVKAQNIVELFMGITVTLCVGRNVTATDQIEVTKNSCRRANWLRMTQGVNQIIYEEKINDCPPKEFITTLNEEIGQLEKSFIALDENRMKETLDSIFELPSPVINSQQGMMAIRGIVINFCELYGKVMHDLAEAERVRKIISRKLHGMETLREYHGALEMQLREYMQLMEGKVKEKNIKPIRQAMVYIEKHYNEEISLERMADEVGLSPVYFSNLFKKETGQNYTEYLTGFKMNKAKQLLKEGNSNINEIAAQLGYADARYFSKVFKKEVGIKPTEYRKIYG